MEALLLDINAVVGVTGSFVCGEDGAVLAAAMPNSVDETALAILSRISAQTAAGLQTTKRRKTGDMDLVFSNGRFIIKNLQTGYLCILCVARINVPLLNLTANVAARKLKGKIGKVVEVKTRPISRPKGERLKQIANEILREHSTKAIELLNAAEESPVELAKACDKIAKMTQLFIGAEQAREVSQKMLAILNEEK